MAILRAFYQADLESVVAVEQSVQITPWAVDTFKMLLQGGYPGWVIENEKKIIGFILISSQGGECHILNIGVLHAYQSQGWGRKLLEQVQSYALLHKMEMAYLEVRKSNTRAISFYKKAGFECVGERKAYYPLMSGAEDRAEDALVFAKQLTKNDKEGVL